ncbi:MAG: peptidylprolyl isomerase [Bacteroidia bacterium]
MKNKLLLLLFAVSLFQISKLNAQGIDKPTYQLEIHRGGVYLGMINIELFPLIAPLATQNFDSLVAAQAYDSTAFHRVVPGFVIQGGDPNSINGPKSTWGYGNPNQPTVNAEFSVVQHLRGRIGAARDADTNSATSQFYICIGSPLYLDGDYTVYGQVTSGMNIADTIVNEPRDANDCPLLKIEMFITATGVNDSIPGSAQLISPADLSTGILDGQQFDWTPVSSAVMYTIEFSTDPNFSTITLWRNTPYDSLSVTGFPSLTTLYWRVKANNGGHESISNVYSFNSATAAPVLISPANGATGQQVILDLTWNSVAGATDYTLQVAKNPFFTAGGMVYNQSGLIDTTQQVTGLTGNTHYYWRVQSAATGIPGSFSSKFSFYTGSTAGINEIVSATKNLYVKSVYPNPAKNNFTVTGNVKQPCSIAFNLKSNTGKIVYTGTKKISKTDFTTTIDVSKLSKGVYFLTVSADGEEVTEKVEVN